jgi:hypothetical protein
MNQKKPSRIGSPEGFFDLFVHLHGRGLGSTALSALALFFVSVFLFFVGTTCAFFGTSSTAFARRLFGPDGAGFVFSFTTLTGWFLIAGSTAGAKGGRWSCKPCSGQ